MNLQIPSWLEAPRSAFEVEDPAIVGTSGGLTSALLAALYHHYNPDAEVQYCFWNTGREAHGTYEFLRKLGDCIPVRFFEVRMPPVYGGGPSTMGFEEVPFDRLDRAGAPFRIFLDTIAQYRAMVKNEIPLGPNPVQRLCTSYMKVKLGDHVAASWWGDSDWTSAIGLRADEPGRVAKMSANNTSTKTSTAPLFKAGINKCHVEQFWKEQPFTLNIEPHQGNCTMCFLKDEADLAEIMLHEPDPDGISWEWWKALDDRFHIRGRGQASYRQIEAEAPMRFAIRDALVNIKPLPRSEEYDSRRFQLVLRQEQKILREGIRRVPCSCESAAQMNDDYVLNRQGCLF